MKLEMIPYSKEWEKIKKISLSSTEASIINGSNKFSGNCKTKLLKLKLGLIEPEKANEVMELGMQMEADARFWFEDTYHVKAKECVYKSDMYDFLIATLDGDIDKDAYVEFKCGAVAYSKAYNGEISDYTIDQIQHSLFVTDKKECFLVFFQLGQDPIVRIITRDDKYIKDLITKELEFYDSWQSTIVRKEEWLEKMRIIKDNDDMIKSLEKLNKEYKEKLYSEFDNKNVLFEDLGLIAKYESGVKITDWKKVCERFSISDEDLEEFKKERKACYKLTSL